MMGAARLACLWEYLERDDEPRERVRAVNALLVGFVPEDRCSM